MSRNNHNAGLHMIRWNHYALDENLEYYDKLVEEQQKKRKQQQQKNKQHQSTSNSKEKNTVKEHEYIIPSKYFEDFDIVPVNMMILAIKNKIDIYQIINEAESMVKKDCRTQRINNTATTGHLMVYHILLNIIADKLNVSVEDFFSVDVEEQKEITKKILNDTKHYWESDSGYIDSKTGDAEICIGACDYIIYDMPHRRTNMSMDLILGREYINNVPYYSLYYGCLSSEVDDYIPKGAYLWWEEKGALEEYIENLIKKHPEWVDNEDYLGI